MTPGPLQIALIIVLVLLLFGAGRVPSIMENLAKGVKGFKKGLSDEESADEVSAKEAPASSKDTLSKDTSSKDAGKK